VKAGWSRRRRDTKRLKFEAEIDNLTQNIGEFMDDEQADEEGAGKESKDPGCGAT
jgi:hypothetical protein